MAPILRRLGADFKFQQDNDPKHKSKVVQRYLSTLSLRFRLAFPMADLNPIENLWGQIKQQLRKLPKSKKHKGKIDFFTNFDSYNPILGSVTLVFNNSFDSTGHGVN
jgi:hypothetical protein